MIRGVFVLCALMCVGLASALSLSAIWAEQRDIPQRCVDANITAVTCEAVGDDALLPHPDDCQLFYYCLSGGEPPVCRQCPAGLHFSPTEHVCAAPAVAGCTVAPPTEASA